jgi:hypothetical protein
VLARFEQRRHVIRHLRPRRGGFRRRAGRQEIIGQHDAFQGGFHGILFLELLQNRLTTLQSEESSVQSLMRTKSG